jgi:hypothetical protein
MDAVVDTRRFPLDDLSCPRSMELVTRGREALAEEGSFSLTGFLRADALERCVAEIEPLMAGEAYRHRQDHDVYFGADHPDLPRDHGALVPLASANHTLTCDQLADTIIRRVYEWPALVDFVAAVLNRPHLFPMRDPLARLNVMGYGSGDALNWHFDRAHFTVTLLLQAPQAGGVFQYRRNLRSESEPNYDAVARLLAGEDPQVRPLEVQPGTLNLFAGRYSPHRITPVEGSRMRLVAVLSFVEAPDVEFSDEDRVQFYGRAS